MISPYIRKKDRMMRVKTGINHLLDNLDIRADEDWAEEGEPLEQLKKLAEEDAGNICNSDQFNLTQPGDKNRILFVGSFEIPEDLSTWQNREKKLQEKLTAMVMTAIAQKIQICFLVKDLKARAALEEYFDAEKRKEMRNAIGNKKVSLGCEYLLVGECSEHVERLTDITHYEVINHPPLDRRINIELGQEDSSDTLPFSALIFTLKLYDFALLYNRVGESLFQDNVRFGIQEVMGVDQAIQTTLEREPEKFWFKNNGITILAKGDFDIFSGTTELNLGKVKPEGKPSFSVVNGAQTICAAARFFFRKEYRAEYKKDAEAKKQLEKAKKDALVLVRVICVSEENEKLANRLIQEIGVALNRQKPIKAEDIAFTTTAAQKLAGCAHVIESASAVRDSQIFRLVRRGEIPDGQEHYLDLVSFARARMACVGEPHTARSKGANTLLKVQAKDDEAFRFTQNNLFPDEWNDVDDSNLRELFYRDYSAVWFAHQMAEAYEEIQQSRQKPENGKQTQVDQWVALQNGKWYCVAAMVYLLNKGDMSNFKNFSAKSEDYNGQLKEIAECIADLAVFALRRRDANVMIDSNTFKRQDVHTELTKVFAGITKCDPEAQKKLDKLSTLVHVSFPIQTIQTPNLDLKPEAGVDSFVVLDKQKVSVKNDTDVFVTIIQYVLDRYPLPKDLSSIDAWLTQDLDRVQKKQGFFRSPHSVSFPNGSGWVGTSSSVKVKLKQLDSLCRLFQVKENTLTWHKQKTEGWFWRAPALKKGG